MKRLLGLSLLVAILFAVAAPAMAEDGEFLAREKARLNELNQLAERIERACVELREGMQKASKEGKGDLAHSLEQRFGQMRHQLEAVVGQIKRQKGRVEVAAHLQEMIKEMHGRREAGNEEGVSEMAEKIAHLRRELSEAPHAERRPEHRPDLAPERRPEHRPDMPRGEGVEARMKKVLEASELIGRSAQLLREAGVGQEAVGQLQQLSAGLRMQVQKWKQAMQEQEDRNRNQSALQQQLEQKERELMELRRRMMEMQRQREGEIRRDSDRPREGEIRRDGDQPREGERERD